MANQYTSLSDRFNALWTPVPIAGCWIWTGAVRRGKTGDERPQINEASRTRIAYRVAYELFKGAIPDGLCVLHTCDVSVCVNPDHLFLGTHKDNQQDAIRKGRHTSQIKPEVCRANGSRTGSKNTWSAGREGRSIIPHADIPKIRFQLANGNSSRVVAESYGVSRQALLQFMKRANARAALTKAKR